MTDELCEYCGNQIIDEALAEQSGGYVFCGQYCEDEFAKEEV